MQCYLTLLGLSKFVYQCGCDVMFCFWNPQFERDMLISLRMTKWQHWHWWTRSIMFSHLSQCSADLVFKAHNPKDKQRDIICDLATWRVRNEGRKGKLLFQLQLKYSHNIDCALSLLHTSSSLLYFTSVSPLVWTSSGSALMQTELESQTWVDHTNFPQSGKSRQAKEKRWWERRYSWYKLFMRSMRSKSVKVKKCSRMKVLSFFIKTGASFTWPRLKQVLTHTH